jgi:hypothetical protein
LPTKFKRLCTTGLQPFQFDHWASQGLSVLLENLSEWLLHQVEVLKVKHTNSVADAADARWQLKDARASLDAEKSSAEIANRRLASELLEAESRILEMTGSVEQHDSTLAELAVTRKQLEEVSAEKEGLEREIRAIFEGVEEVLNEPESSDGSVGPGQVRGVLKGGAGTSPKKAAREAVAGARPKKGRVAELAASYTLTRPANICIQSSPSSAPKRVNYFKGVLTERDLTPKAVFLSPKKEVITDVMGHRLVCSSFRVLFACTNAPRCCVPFPTVGAGSRTSLRSR